MGTMNRELETVDTLGAITEWGAKYFEQSNLFFGHGTDNAWDEALTLVLFAMDLPWDSSSDIFNNVLSSSQKEAVQQLFERRVNEAIPAAYLTGEAWFAGFPFKVDPRVLVPRSPMAELIEVQFRPWLVKPPSSILDLCTGSGCIGIACAHYFPEAIVVLSDISLDALAVAQQNIEQHQLSSRVKTVESDLFSSIPASHQYDLIVSNPPYVDAADLASMPKEYHHEPEIGLASGFDGLDFTRRLLREALAYLTDQGILVVEVGNSWEALEVAFPSIPFMWLEFERGGHGVFLLTAEQLKIHQQELR